jgi:hypothetical protein
MNRAQLQERIAHMNQDQKRAFLGRLWTLLSDDSLAPQMPEEVDEELRAAGYDPDVVGKKLAASFKQVLAEQAQAQRL